MSWRWVERTAFFVVLAVVAVIGSSENEQLTDDLRQERSVVEDLRKEAVVQESAARTARQELRTAQAQLEAARALQAAAEARAEVLRREAQARASRSRRASTAPTPRPEAQPAAYGVWDRLAQCEATGRWDANTGNGYYGGLQFSLSSWRAVGGSGYPHQASREEQIRRGQALQRLQGWGAWPACSRKLGLR